MGGDLITVKRPRARTAVYEIQLGTLFPKSETINPLHHHSHFNLLKLNLWLTAPKGATPVN